MANLIPLAIADLELQLASSISVGGESFTLSSAVDDDGEALPAGKYCFTLDSGTSNKEYLIGQVNGVNVTSVKSVSRQGVESTGAVRTHRVGSPCIVTNFATLQRVADILRGQIALDGASPVGYDAEPTLSDRKDLATVGYVLDAAFGGAITFDQQVITGTAGETVAAGELVYFKTSDQEWYLTDADTAATVEGVQLGVALGAGTDGVGISGGVQISGKYTTTGLTAGSIYYAGNTAGAYTTSAGTTNQAIGLAVSTTDLLLIPRNPETPTSGEKAAMVGSLGTPNSTNRFVTQAGYDPFFGDGSDGDVIISSPTTLTRNMYYDNLTVTSTLTTDGFKIYVKGTLDGAGTIKWGTPNAGANGTTGVSTSTSNGGAGGASSGSGLFKNIAGSDGANGQATGSISNPPTGDAGISVNPSNGVDGATGGTGGGGDQVEQGAASAGGVATSAQTKFGVGKFGALEMVDISIAGTLSRILGSAGSGGGGGGGSDDDGTGQGGGGGGAGASGGTVWIAAYVWAGTFTMDVAGAAGGNGGNAFAGGSADIGTGGGGAGGAGGVTVVIYASKTWTGSYNLAGGAGGAGGAVPSDSGQAGSSGSTGTTGIAYELDYSNLL